MKIDTRFTTSPASSTTSTASSGQNDFASALAAVQSRLGDNSATPAASLEASATTGSSGETGKTESDYEAAVRELHEYLSKTPEQRMREAILKEMGVTEEVIQKMSPDQQNAIEAAIKEKVKEKLLEQAQDNVDSAMGAHRSSPEQLLPL